MTPFIMSFPIWALVFSGIALLYPTVFIDLKTWIVPLLMAVMLGMGLSLKVSDFVQVWRNRKAVATGVGLQFAVMPLLAWLLSIFLDLSTELTIGMMLVGATAGGTASNVMTYLAKGDVALSVSMTLVSTLAAVILLPFLTWLYLDQVVDVPALAMLAMLLKLIVLPLAVGVFLNRFLHRFVCQVTPLLPLFSMAVIILIIAIVVALNAANVTTVAGSLVVAIIVHNALGLLSGYSVCRLLGYDSKIARTVAIEVGMQNSGLSVALALKYFSAASALPGALFSVWHNLSGALFASYWQAQESKKEP